MTDIQLTADEYTVRVKENVRLDEYESHTVEQELTGSVEGVHTLENGMRNQLKARLSEVRSDLQSVVEQGCEARETRRDDNE